MILKSSKQRLLVKFLILSFLILGAFETAALVGFRILSRNIVNSQFADREKRNPNFYLRAQKIYHQFKRFDLHNKEEMVKADEFISNIGDIFDWVFWVTDSNGNIHPRGFKPSERYLKAEPMPGFSYRFKIDNQTKANKLFDLFQPPFPRKEESLYKIPFVESDGRTTYINFTYKRTNKDSKFDSIYLLDHLPNLLSGYVGILSSLPLMLIILYLLVIRPISRLQQSTNRIASGKLSHRNRVSGNDEIAQLGRSFNNMADQIQKMIQNTREISGRLSHELRSPMSRLNLKKDLILLELEKIDSNLKARNLAEDMSKEIKQIDMLIDQMLDFARMDAANAESPKKAVDFIEILNDTIDAYATDFQHHEINLSVQIGLKNLEILSSEQDLIALFQNLMSNALKFTPRKGIIDIQLKREKGTVVLGFANTCEPLDETILARIFEPFYRLDDNSKPGNGLGLAIVKKIVENLNGQITVEPWDEKGIRFKIKLPLPHS